jgi:hypothetical protein
MGVAMEYREFVFAGMGKRHFTLSEDSISIGRTRTRSNVTLLLKGLEAEYRTVRQRSPAFVVGLIALFVGLACFVFGLVFNSEDMAKMRRQTSSQQAKTMLGRQLTVQVGEEEPVTGVVNSVRTDDGEPQLIINSKSYSVQDVIHVKADRREVFALAVISGVLSLFVLLSSWRIVAHAVFKNTTGVDAISIARAGPDIASFDVFVDELSRRIQQAKDD